MSVGQFIAHVFAVAFGIIMAGVISVVMLLALGFALS